MSSCPRSLCLAFGGTSPLNPTVYPSVHPARRAGWTRALRGSWLAGLVWALALSNAQAADTLPLSRQTVQGGVKAELTLKAAQPGPVPLQQPVDIALQLTDELSGAPLRGLRPRLWLSRQGTDQPEPCDAQIRRFASGRLAQRADRDLNSFQLLTLNADASVSVINPQVQLNNTRLEALITLPGTGTDWVHARAQDRLFITLADRGELAVVDLSTNKLVKTLALGAGQPRRLVISPDESTVWVAMDGSDRLVAVDAATLAVRQTLKTGPGSHALALSADGRRLVVTSSSGRVSIIDTAASRVLAHLAVKGTPLAVDYSALSRRAYVATLNAPKVTVIDADAGKAVAEIALPTPLSTLRVDPSGRYLLGVHTASSRLVAIDAARNRVVASAAAVAQPDQVVYTSRYAFVRGLGSQTVQMVELRALDEGRLALNEVPIFQKPASAQPEHIGPADLMAASPEGDSMLMASAPDTAMYYYTEGMMAPQGTYRTYSRAARALRVVDRSLRETAPGVYTASLKLDRGGRYSLPMVLAQPRVVECFAFAVDEVGATQAGRRLDLDWRWTTAPGATPVVLQAGDEHEVQLQVRDAITGEPVTGVRDLQIMALAKPGLAQQRLFATEDRDATRPGIYRARFRFLRPGLWQLSVQSVSLGLSFDRSRTLDFSVQPGPDGAAAPLAPLASTAPAGTPAASAP